VEIPLLDLQAQYRELKDEIDDAVDSVMATAGFIGGPRVAEFEDAMADYCGTGHAVSCANGTDALILILESLGVGPGHEFITSPFTFFATAEAVARVGAVPVFVDIEPDTYNVDPARIEAAITDRTRAVMPVHIFGQCADIDAVRDVAAPRELFVVEDACQAIGATYRGKKAGSLADAAAFSFFPSKNLGGAGDGGMVTTDDADLAARVRLLANHGSSEKYIHAAVGHNSRLDALQAAVLDVKLKYLDRWNASRREAAAVYDELLAGLPVTTPSTRAYGDSAYHLYIVRTP
jgi:dTDP-4-amino-4,6-dideoxygalactose transaminase